MEVYTLKISVNNVLPVLWWGTGGWIPGEKSAGGVQEVGDEGGGILGETRAGGVREARDEGAGSRILSRWRKVGEIRRN